LLAFSLAFSLSNQLGSLRDIVPLPKKPISQSARTEAWSVMCTERVSELKVPVMGVSLWEDGAEMSWER
jgi:hypothetical protein